MSEKSAKASEDSSVIKQELQQHGVNGNPAETTEKKKKPRVKRSAASTKSSTESNVAASSSSEVALPSAKRPKVKRLKPRGLGDVSAKDASKEQLKREKAEIKKINDELFYTKLVSGLLVGIALGLFIYITDERSLYVFLVFSMIALLGIVIYIRYIRKISEEKLSWAKLYLSGTFTYLIVIVVISSLVWMFLVYFLQGPIPRPGS